MQGLCACAGAAHGFGEAAGACVGDAAAEDTAAGTQVDPTLPYPSAGPFCAPASGARLRTAMGSVGQGLVFALLAA